VLVPSFAPSLQACGLPSFLRVLYECESFFEEILLVVVLLFEAVAR